MQLETRCWYGEIEEPGYSGYLVAAEVVGFPDEETAARFQRWLQPRLAEGLAEFGSIVWPPKQ